MAVGVGHVHLQSPNTAPQLRLEGVVAGTSPVIQPGNVAVAAERPEGIWIVATGNEHVDAWGSGSLIGKYPIRIVARDSGTALSDCSCCTITQVLDSAIGVKDFWGDGLPCRIWILRSWNRM